MRRRLVSFLTCAGILASLLCSPAQANTLSEEELYAQSAVLMDGENGRVLFSKEGDRIMPMASTTKVMTCIIALEYGSQEACYPVSSYAASMPQVKLGVSSGEQYRQEDLLYSLMLESHNDSAIVIAEGIAGSVEGFCALMNEKARELGCRNTNFVTPNGLDAEGHHTTAAELARIAAYAIQNETFLAITQTRSYTFSEASGARTFCVNNKNAFLDSFEGCISGKTGYTGKAGYCYVGVVQREEKTLIGVVLACGWPPSKSWKWHDMRILINYGLKQYSHRSAFQGVPLLDVIEVEDGKKGQVSVGVTGEVTLLLREGENVRVTYDYPEKILAPVQKGEQVGTAYVYAEEHLAAALPIVTNEGDKKIQYLDCLEQAAQLFLLSFSLTNG